MISLVIPQNGDNKTKGHDQKLIMSIVASKSGLVHILFSYLDVMIS
jgi:hypothetical protein